MTVSARERRHFQAIRTAKQAEHEERVREALEKHPVERIREGLALGAAPLDPKLEASLDRRALAQAELARRGRALGMRVERDERREAP